MAFNLSGALSASRSLSNRNAELLALRQALNTYQSNLHASWSSSEVAQIDIAIARIKDKINRAQRQIDNACHAMNKGAAALKTKEDTERMQERTRALSAGGGGGVGGR